MWEKGKSNNKRLLARAGKAVKEEIFQIQSWLAGIGMNEVLLMSLRHNQYWEVAEFLKKRKRRVNMSCKMTLSY